MDAFADAVHNRLKNTTYLGINKQISRYIVCPHQTMYLSILIYVEMQANKKRKEKLEYIYCKRSYVTAEIGWTIQMQKTAVQKLQENGWIEVKRGEESQPKNYYKINFKKISMEIFKMTPKSNKKMTFKEDFDYVPDTKNQSVESNTLMENQRDEFNHLNSNQRDEFNPFTYNKKKVNYKEKINKKENTRIGKVERLRKQSITLQSLVEMFSFRFHHPNLEQTLSDYLEYRITVLQIALSELAAKKMYGLLCRGADTFEELDFFISRAISNGYQGVIYKNEIESKERAREKKLAFRNDEKYADSNYDKVVTFCLNGHILKATQREYDELGEFRLIERHLNSKKEQSDVK